MADGVYVDASGIKALAVDLMRAVGGVDLAVATEMPYYAGRLAEHATNIKDQYPASGNSDGSARAAISIRAEVETKRQWRIKASGHPLAGLWELGNKKSDANDPEFRHPTFGHDPWKSQRKWEYLRRAVDEYGPTIELELGDKIVREVETWVAPAGVGSLARVGRSSIGTLIPLGPYTVSSSAPGTSG